MKRIEKTVFVSYRRADQAWALAIYQRLTQRGFDVFVDYLGLGSGSFEREILENIAARAHFLVLLTARALDRVGDPGDWLRREVEEAIRLKRNVIPVLLDGFDFDAPETRARLTGGLETLSQYNGLPIPDGYFDAAMDRLERRFLCVEIDTVLHPASADAVASAEDQQAAAAGAARQVVLKAQTTVPSVAPAGTDDGGPAPVAQWPTAGAATGGDQGAAAMSLPSAGPVAAGASITVRGDVGQIDFSWTLGDRSGTRHAKQHFQPGLAEKLIHQQQGSTAWREDFSRLLFRILVPPELRQLVPQLGRVVLELDERVAFIPWEMLLPGGHGLDDQPGLPFALRTRLTRRLISDRPQPSAPARHERWALVIGNPSIDGFAEAFAGTGERPVLMPPSLPGAEKEAEHVTGQLSTAGYRVRSLIGEENSAGEVLSALLDRPWRIVHIAGHGVVDLPHRDGDRRSGVLLSDGVLLTAVEVAAMEPAPELVFVDCSHLGRLDGSNSKGRLATSLLKSLLDLGVRCVVVAGWAVSDAGAITFARVFYEELVRRGQPFGAAVFAARHAAWASDSADITWGAFQAYGDPDWTLRP